MKKATFKGLKTTKLNHATLFQMSENKQIIKFKAVKVVNESTQVSFTTKDGKRVTFEATKAVEKPVNVQFRAKPKK